MIILGLGSNIGDRLDNLRKAVKAIRNVAEIKVIKLSPLYLSDALLPDNAPTEWDQPYLNLALSCRTTLTPFELLDKLKTIEWSIGRKPETRHWGPRILDIDILVFNNEIIHSDRLTIPHASLLERPFSLWPLCDLAPHWVYPLEGPEQGLTASQLIEQFGSRFTGKAPLHTWQLYQRIEGPTLVGVINATPDSFSDGGLYVTPEKAVQQALDLVEAGAEIIDLGAESTAPRAKPIDRKTEWARLQPILLALKEARDAFVLPPKISLDTYHPDIAKKALDIGIDWLNDVTGLTNPELRDIAKSSSVNCVMMHHLTIPASKMHVIDRQKDALQEVLEWGKKQIDSLVNEGFDPTKLIFDPGIGFGKTPEQSMQLIKQAEQFNVLQVPVLIGHSRKSFYSLLTCYPPHERDIETIVTTYALCDKEIAYLRVHNVEASARALKVHDILKG